MSKSKKKKGFLVSGTALKELQSHYSILIITKQTEKKFNINFSYICQGIEVTGENATPKIGETGRYREPKLAGAETMRRSLHRNQYKGRKPEL